MQAAAQAREETVSFDALDGTPLAGTVFEPKAPRASLLVNSGTGIPRRFYARFARHAAARGFAVLTFDYRGIGGSAPASLRGYQARYRDWGQRDIPGAIGWLADRYDGLPLAAVGHSTGGQQLGLAPNVERVRAAVFVAVSTGYWRGMPTLYKWFTFALWRLYLPLAAPLYGYAPARKIRWGENLPAGVAREWGAWCMEPTIWPPTSTLPAAMSRPTANPSARSTSTALPSRSAPIIFRTILSRRKPTPRRCSGSTRMPRSRCDG